ncbi:MAG: hypothetical protein HN656_10725 [Acidiferrobacteraceae bacterium]|nr:hypothetical protein [Acidiferrobacteraceae bacterium]MBT4404291.1 hypothetical protein [Acidiferrobacteraceae bacterium]MBT5981385.1 hypothetical protein [Acidiferrobacteraceae bacterium]MBT7518400.1 hypothetical protein [Acidiferrobacteraceae bacterium]
MSQLGTVATACLDVQVDSPGQTRDCNCQCASQRDGEEEVDQAKGLHTGVSKGCVVGAYSLPHDPHLSLIQVIAPV